MKLNAKLKSLKIEMFTPRWFHWRILTQVKNNTNSESRRRNSQLNL